jgi:hypothetical protein
VNGFLSPPLLLVNHAHRQQQEGHGQPEHGLTPDEVDEVLLDDTIPTAYSASTQRPCKFGYTSTGKHIIVVWDEVNDDPRIIYPVTSYEVPEPR